MGLLQERRELFHVPGKFRLRRGQLQLLPPFVVELGFRFLLFLAQGVSIDLSLDGVVVVQYQMDVGVVASFQMLFYGLQDSRVLCAGFRQGVFTMVLLLGGERLQ